MGDGYYRNRRRGKKRRPRSKNPDKIIEFVQTHYLDTDQSDLTDERCRSILDKHEGELHAANVMDWALDDLAEQLARVEGLEPRGW